MKRVFPYELPIGLFILASPFLHRVEFVLAGTTAIFVLLYTALLSLLIVVLRSGKTGFTFPDLCFMLWVVWMAGNGFLRNVPVDPVKVFEAAGLCICYAAVRGAGDGRLLLTAIALSGGSQVILCLLQWLGIAVSHHAGFPVTGSFNNPGPLAGFLTVAFVATGYMTVVYGKNSFLRSAIVIYMGILLGLLIFLGSRTAWFAGLSSGLFLLGQGRQKTAVQFRQWFRKRKWLVLLPVIAVCLLATGLYHWKKPSADGRLLIWKVSLNMIREAPLTGYGPSGFERNYMIRQGEYFIAYPDSQDALLAGNTFYAFNEYLRIGVEYGVPGLLLFLLFISGMFSHRPQNRIALYTGAGLVCLLVFALSGYPGSILSFRLLFVVFCAIRINHAGFSIWYAVPFSYRIKVVIFFASVVVVWLTLPDYRLRYKADRELIRVMSGKETGNQLSLENYYIPLSCNPEFVTHYGYILYHRKRYAEAIPKLQQTILLRPAPELISDLGDAFFYTGAYTEAERCYLQAGYMVPCLITPTYKLFNLYCVRGQTDKALQTAHRLVNVKVKVVNSVTLEAKRKAEEFLKKQKGISQ